MEEIAVLLDSLKRCIRKKIILNCNMDMSYESRNKFWENTANDRKEFSHRPHKKAVVNFTLKARYDCLAEHLKRIGILTNSLCNICKTDNMNKEHLLVCPGLDPRLQLRGDDCLLDWGARDCMP
ncbi:hypothetical protein NPIL_84791 [Nephila pilipes]|uniref:Uncharacterized protein n=1 Tax=Nephila pilipes TaxID=299642 RepID=A0A8X6UID6_NEPPI|nr:hypothetical protein NPIL_84791 [Nephila pilipes]